MAKPELILSCECPDLSHVVRISEFDQYAGTVSIEFLVAPKTLGDRLHCFWRSLFGFGLFHDVVLSKEQSQQLAQWLQDNDQTASKI